MATIEQIRGEILDYNICKDVIEVSFEDYILEVDLKDLEGLKVNTDTLAKVIFKKYQEGN